MQALGFHGRHAWFNLREQFSDLGSGIAGFLIFPFFIWLLGELWTRFNAYQGHYSLDEVRLYIGVTEILFITFLRSGSLSRASGDFSISLARPRSWLAMSFSGLFGRCLGGRFIYLAIFLVVLPLLGARWDDVLLCAARLLLLLPLLGLIQGLIGLIFASSQVMWAQTEYFVLPVSKIFLALGGVFGPLADFGEPWRKILIALPASDLFFQPAHFCVKGSFYEMSATTWALRVLGFAAALAAFNLIFHRQARLRHQSYGG